MKSKGSKWLIGTSVGVVLLGKILHKVVNQAYCFHCLLTLDMFQENNLGLQGLIWSQAWYFMTVIPAPRNSNSRLAMYIYIASSWSAKESYIAGLSQTQNTKWGGFVEFPPKPPKPVFK